MKQTLTVLIVFIFLAPGVLAWAQADEPEGAVVTMTGLKDEIPEIEIIVLEDGTEEVQEILTASAYAPLSADGSYLAIQADTRQRIDALLEQIQGLADGNEEGELQRQIEQIKMEAEIERLSLFQEDAEVREDYQLADELSDEIEHLGRIDEPVIGYQEDKQPQQVNE